VANCLPELRRLFGVFVALISFERPRLACSPTMVVGRGVAKQAVEPSDSALFLSEGPQLFHALCVRRLEQLLCGCAVTDAWFEEAKKLAVMCDEQPR